MTNDAHREHDWLIPAALAIAALCALVWIVAGTAGLLFGGGWPGLAAAQLPAALLGWATHLSDPAAGFPDNARLNLPGPIGMYSALALVLAAGARLGATPRRARPRHRNGLVAALVLSAHRLTSAQGERRGARWATRRDLDPLTVPGPTQGRLTLGRAGGRLVAAEARQSALIVGPTQMLKTAGLAIPALLEWEGPVLATSVKRDLLDTTTAARERRGKMLVYDPAAVCGVESCGWNPLDNCRTWQGALRSASWLVAAAGSAPGPGHESRFWDRAAEKLLAPLLYAAATNGLLVADVLRWINTRDYDEVQACLVANGAQAALHAWTATTLRDERTTSSIYTTAETVLCAFEDPNVLDTSIRHDISIEQLLDKHATAYICAPPHEQERLAPLFSTLVSEIIASAYDRYSRTGKPLDPPLLLLLDELGNVAPIPGLERIASTAAGIGIQLVSVFHDLSQIHRVYGNAAETIVNNHRAKIILAGTGDERTLAYVARTLGDEQVQQVSMTRDQARRSSTESTSYRPLAPANLTRQQPAGTGLLIYGNQPPAQIQLRAWFKDRHLTQLAAPGQNNRRSLSRWPLLVGSKR